MLLNLPVAGYPRIWLWVKESSDWLEPRPPCPLTPGPSGSQETELELMQGVRVLPAGFPPWPAWSTLLQQTALELPEAVGISHHKFGALGCQ